MRSTFAVTAPIVRARLYITAHGLYRAEINNQRVGDDELAPGWTSYSHRLRVYTYDVTALLREGSNAIGVTLADGWFRGRVGFHGGHSNLYGTQTALLAQVRVDLADGTHIVHGTGPEWSCAPGPIMRTNLLEGESFDARETQNGWSTPGFAESWEPAAPREIDLHTLTAPDGPPVRCVEERSPAAVRSCGGGRFVIDFGQNLVGRLRIEVDGISGHEITIRHAEVLDAEGELYTRPLRGAYSIDRYILDDSGVQQWEPAFTIHGFRYAELSGWPDNLPIDGRVVARVIHTDMARTGWFSSSDEDLNRLHENVVWSMRGNFVDLPTDCPQRDERLGWTGDIQIFAPTAGYLFDCAGLLASWLRDVAAEQQPDGTVPWYVPVIPGGDQWTPPRPGAGWGDAAVIVPAALYAHFGDTDILRRQYPSARAWSDLQARLAGDNHVWDTSYQLGDWLDPSAPPDDPANGMTDPNLVATAYFARSAAILADFEIELDSAERRLLRERANLARKGFRSRYLSAPGTLTSDSQAAYAIAIVFGLFDQDELAIAGDNLARLVRAADYHLTTGFLGTPTLLDALTLGGHIEVAYALLRQRSVPSWLYPVTMGATTIWERWDSMLPDGSVNPGDMTSFNHFAFGSVADWMHRTVAGMAPLSPGWTRIRFRPGYESGLDAASAVHQTPLGRAEISWQRSGTTITATVVVPVGAVGAFEGPKGETTRLTSGTHQMFVDAA
nr:alpha-L-rhamnosidase [Microbacterium endophyticum]